MTTSNDRLVRERCSCAFGLSCLAALLAPAPGARAQDHEYQVSVIDAGPTTAFGINQCGTVVGQHGPDAFMWTEEEGLVPLPLPRAANVPEAYDVNDNGQITGIYVSEDRGFGYLGFLLDRGTFTPLGTLAGGNWSEALAINNNGQIAGFWGNNVTGPWQAFIWQDGKMIDLGPDLGYSRALDLNEQGQVTGWMGNIAADAHAFVWNEGAVTDLGPIPGGITSEGRAINALGQVAGIGRIPWGLGFVIHPFFHDGVQAIDLGTLSGVFDEGCRAMDINDWGQIVGYCDTVDGNVAFIWEDFVMTALDALVEHPGQVEVDVARGINNAGQIIAEGSVTGLGNVTLLLTPGGASNCNCPADLDGSGAVDVQDLVAVTLQWGPCPIGPPCPPDLDGDGTVAVGDLVMLILSWGDC